MLNECPCCGFDSALIPCGCDPQEVAAATAAATAAAAAVASTAAAAAAAEPGPQDFRRNAESAGFVIGDQLGKGLFGVVFRAERNGVSGALKLAAGASKEAEAYERLKNHPSTPRFYDSGPGWIFLELVEGRPARGFHELQCGRNEARNIAEATRVEHCDLHEGNIMICPDGRIVIIDWRFWAFVP